MFDRGESDAEVCVLERRETYAKGRKGVWKAMEGASMQEDGDSRYARQEHRGYAHQRRELERETMETDDRERRWSDVHKTRAQGIREVGGWGRDPKKCTGRDWGMGSSTI